MTNSQKELALIPSNHQHQNTYHHKQTLKPQSNRGINKVAFYEPNLNSSTYFAFNCKSYDRPEDCELSANKHGSEVSAYFKLSAYFNKKDIACKEAGVTIADV